MVEKGQPRWKGSRKQKVLENPQRVVALKRKDSTWLGEKSNVRIFLWNVLKYETIKKIQAFTHFSM